MIIGKIVFRLIFTGEKRKPIFMKRTGMSRKSRLVGLGLRSNGYN
jgi:hypothetical protein